jgi:ankyrin repeat protein
MHDQPQILELLLAHDASPPTLAPADAMVGALLAGDSDRAGRIEAASPGALDAARLQRKGLIAWAAASGHGQVIPLLVAQGFDVNRRARMDVPREEEWEAALHVAVERDDVQMAQMLLGLGADPNVRDARYDATPLGWAEHFNRPALIELLAPVTSPSTDRQ